MARKGDGVIVEVAADDNRVTPQILADILTHRLYLFRAYGIGLCQLHHQQLRLSAHRVSRHLALQQLAILPAVLFIQVTTLKVVVHHDDGVLIHLQPPRCTTVIADGLIVYALTADNGILAMDA